MNLISLEKETLKVDSKITYFLDPDYIYIPYKRLTIKQDSDIKIDDLSSVSGKVFGI